MHSTIAMELIRLPVAFLENFKSKYSSIQEFSLEMGRKFNLNATSSNNGVCSPSKLSCVNLEILCLCQD